MNRNTAELADENSTNAPEMPGMALTIGDSRISAADTRMARAGTLRSDTLPSLFSIGFGDTSDSWYRWRPAEYNSELSDEDAAVITTKNTRADAQFKPAYWNIIMNGDAKEPSLFGLNEVHGTMHMMATSAPT